MFRLAQAAVVCVLATATVRADDAGRTYEVEAHKNLAYVEGSDRDPEGFHTLDVFAPKGVKAAPVLLFIHGGGWTRREGDGPAKGRGGTLTRGFASRGVVLVTISYRLSPAHKHPVHVQDVARAIAWTKANAAKFGGDPDRLFLTGHSAGGHLATLVVADPKYLAAHKMTAADIRGVVPISGTYTVAGREKVWGDEAGARDASPTNHLRAGLPPFLILAGDTTDIERWVARQSGAFAEALRAKGNSAEYREIKNRDHSTIITKLAAPGDPAGELILRFIREHSGERSRGRE